MADRATFREFLESRRDLQNLGTWEDVARKTGVGTATVTRIIKERPGRHTTTLASRNPVAEALGFKNWPELLSAWAQTGADLPAGPAAEVTELVLPTRLLTEMHAAAARRRMTLEQWLAAQVQSHK